MVSKTIYYDLCDETMWKRRIFMESSSAFSATQLEILFEKTIFGNWRIIAKMLSTEFLVQVQEKSFQTTLSVVKQIHENLKFPSHEKRKKYLEALINNEKTLSRLVDNIKTIKGFGGPYMIDNNYVRQLLSSSVNGNQSQQLLMAF